MKIVNADEYRDRYCRGCKWQIEKPGCEECGAIILINKLEVDADDPPPAKWIPHPSSNGLVYMPYDYYTCTDCGRHHATPTKHCPNCGKRMEMGELSNGNDD